MAAPLADRIRPETLDDIVGQRHLLGEGKALRNIIQSGTIPNLIFYGPSGTGKTTVASMIAKQTNKRLYRLNATNASISDIKDMVSELNTLAAPNGILLYLDEIQYFNKKQQQSLLEYLESGDITMIASTTENPYFYVYNAVISRCTVFEFKSVSAADIELAVQRAFRVLAEEGGAPYQLEDGVSMAIARASGGDVRKSINTVELCALSCGPERSITLDLVEQLTQKSSVRYDRAGDDHYDILSAFQKSMRGSDPDAALHYLARLLSAGDLPSAIRPFSGAGHRRYPGWHVPGRNVFQCYDVSFQGRCSPVRRHDSRLYYLSSGSDTASDLFVCRSEGGSKHAQHVPFHCKSGYCADSAWLCY